MTLLHLGTSVGKRNVVFCSTVSVVVSLGMHRWWVPVPRSHFGGRAGTAAHGWHPQEDLKRLLETSKKEEENWVALCSWEAEVSLVLTDSGH